MAKLFDVYKNVFASLTPAQFGDSLRLQDIAAWDSMNTVTLVLVLEDAYGVSLADAVLTKDTTVKDVVSLLQSKGAAAE